MKKLAALRDEIDGGAIVQSHTTPSFTVFMDRSRRGKISYVVYPEKSSYFICFPSLDALIEGGREHDVAEPVWYALTREERRAFIKPLLGESKQEKQIYVADYWTLPPKLQRKVRDAAISR